MQYTIAPEFESDLDNIWLYIARESGSIQIASQFLYTIQQRIPLIASSPYIGRMRADLRKPGLRSFPVGDYLIFYRLSNLGIRFLRVIHGSRNLQRLFNIA